MMTWLRSSVRTDLTQRSATPFCQGEWKEVRLGLIPSVFWINLLTPAEKMLSRSNMRYLGFSLNGNASLSCCLTHWAEGCWVTLVWMIFLRPWMGLCGIRDYLIQPTLYWLYVLNLLSAEILAFPDRLLDALTPTTAESRMACADSVPGGFDDLAIGGTAMLGKLPRLASMKLPGPKLAQKVADTFSNSKYVNRQLQTDEIFYKYHGVDNRTGRKVSWFTNKKYANETELRSQLAIRKDWGVNIQFVSKFKVPKGTWISEGTAAAQGAGYPGKGYQAVIQNVPKTWVQNTTKAFP